ncbi:hypothetical protein HZS_2885 [Henneguya salminicola]|uniref:Far upstream element-binding protein 2 (Trinotate prediction) n=1 Tax=Henneguya salminicola TaxID=69463 RepID=A0A6G3MGQ4_HENSL|nr:hypothetical protein HZS_2885 [Henneguya salminicola]
MEETIDTNSTSISLTFLCTDQYAGLIIGKGGSNIKQITQQSKCKIILKGKMGGIRHLQITGKPDNITEAIELIAKTIQSFQHGPQDLDQKNPDNPILLLMLLPREVSGAVIGKYGSNIKNIRTISKAFLKIVGDKTQEIKYDTLYLEGINYI